MRTDKKIYFDNAATSWPKPKQVAEAINNFITNIGSSAGRSGHSQSVEAGRIVYDTRELIAELFNIKDPLDIAFTLNSTMALNLIIFGLLDSSSHVITSSLEHNSVMRPLRSLEKKGLEISQIKSQENEYINLSTLREEIENQIKKNTKAIIFNHASNVTGTILPIKEIGNIAKKHGIPMCVDASQSAGSIPIDIIDMNIDLLAFTGHKSLLGPQGTGGMYISKKMQPLVNTVIFGGTGSFSEEESQPDYMPDKYESGTKNSMGISGLAEGIKFIRKEGIERIRNHEKNLTKFALQEMNKLPDIKIYGPKDSEKQSSVIAFNIKGEDPGEVALFLDENKIMTRPGLHCAPSAHKTIGTFPMGTNRISFGYFNTIEEIEYFIKILKKYKKEK